MLTFQNLRVRGACIMRFSVAISTGLLALACTLAISAQQRDRSTVADKYKWDLTHIYPSDDAWRGAKDKIVAEAQSAAAKERDRAVAEIASAKNQALREIAQQSVSTAISLASNIIRREVKPEDHDKLIADSLSKFSNLN
jgi:oligoendopeptidase F